MVDRLVDKDEVDRIGQGQVWTGTDALENGLIDELGSLDEAIKAAALYAGLEEGGYGIKSIEPELSATEQFLVDALGVVTRAGMDLSSWFERPVGINDIAQRIAGKADSYLRFNDPRGVYTHCLCSFD